jgi:integrase
LCAPGELRHAEWKEFDLEAAVWSLPADKMKGGQPHIVPLSRQAVAVLRELHPLTGSSPYVFPANRDWHRPMSNGAVLMALRRMGYTGEQMTGHGVRAMARTIMDEVLGERPEIIEQQLAHAVKDPLGRAYNRTKHLPQRKAMMQRWADYLDGLRVGNVVPFPKAVAG